MHFGTSVSKGWDVRSIAKAIAGPDVDTRCWLSLGIVATIRDLPDDVENLTSLDLINDRDPSAVIVGPEGVEVDVVMVPTMDHLTCRVPSGGRKSTDDSPIGPGDEVLIAIPMGVPDHGVVVAVLNSASDRLPVGDDGKPLFQNDRRLIWADGIPIDLRTGPVRVEMNPGADEWVVTATQVKLGGHDAVEALLLGTSYRGAEQPAMVAQEVFNAAVAAAIAADTMIPPMLRAAVAAAATALSPLMTAFNASLFLSAVSRTK